MSHKDCCVERIAHAELVSAAVLCWVAYRHGSLRSGTLTQEIGSAVFPEMVEVWRSSVVWHWEDVACSLHVLRDVR